MKQSFSQVKPVVSQEEGFEASGFVMDCILASGAQIDGHIGDKASLRPVDMVLDESGKIIAVVCIVRPCDAGALKGLLRSAGDNTSEQRFLIAAPA